MRRMWIVVALLWHASSAVTRGEAQVTLTGLRQAKFRDSASSVSADGAKIKIARDPALLVAGDPTCIGGDDAELFLASSNNSSERLVLPCVGWSARNGSFRYRDSDGSTGGVRKLQYREGELTVQLKGENYRVISGPVDWIEISFRIGGTTYCARTTQFERNDAGGVTAVGPSTACVPPTEPPTQTPSISPTPTRTPTLTKSPTHTPTRTLPPAHTATHTELPTQTLTATQTSTQTVTATASPTPTTAPVCGDGIRQGSEQCDDGNAESDDCCSPACLRAAAGADCHNDGNLCTDDKCGTDGTCQHLNNTATCNDGSACTQSDQCSNGACGGALIRPWINEVNYDGYDLLIATRDHEEFVEIAGPAGLDLSGYKLSAVEGAGTGTIFNPCLSGGLNAGEAYFTASLPSGTIIGDDTGKGTGFVVVCFDNTSGDIESDGKCDVVLGNMPSQDSNLKEGSLSNLFDCADGVLLRDATDGVVDAVSYEGTIANRGTFGAAFIGAPNIGRDWGLATDFRRSLVKTTENLQRETNASKWADSGNGDDSPGAVNGLQNLSCYQAPGYTNTQYPIVLLHGLFGFDSLFGVIDYWNGIPEALMEGGATVSVATTSQLNSPQARGEQAIPQIEQLLAQTGKSKVNLIGHSQGGLDARYIAAVRPDLVASVTTIASPHKGAAIADLLAAAFHEGSFGEDVLALLGNALGNILATISGSTNPNDAILPIRAMTSEAMATFNATYPAGVPTTACGEGAGVANGIHFFSWSGTGIHTNPLDESDDYLGYASLVYPEANDGLVGRCSSHFGDVIRDDYFQNHIDEVNLLFGLVSPFEVNPKTLFRQHANRLKNLGL